MAVIPRRAGFFPPEVLEDVRGVGRRLVGRRRASEGGAARAGLFWLWVLLLVYPFTDYLFTALEEEGVPGVIAAGAFIMLDAGIIVAVMLSRGDAAGARFVGETDLEKLLNSSNGITYYNAAASVIPMFLILAVAQAAAIGAMLSGGGSPLAYQITVEAMAVGFTAIFIMLLTDEGMS